MKEECGPAIFYSAVGRSRSIPISESASPKILGIKTITHKHPEKGMLHTASYQIP